MENSRGNAHGLKGTIAADAEEQLLTNARASVAPVEARGKFHILRRIACHIRVEQQQGATPNLEAPDLGAYSTAAGLNLHYDRFPFFSNSEFHGELIDVGVEVLLPLPALLVQVLQEVALPIKQADADERNAEVGGALDVVSSKHAQAAGINGQGLVQAEFSRKVGDGTRPQHPCIH